MTRPVLSDSGRRAIADARRERELVAVASDGLHPDDPGPPEPGPPVAEQSHAERVALEVARLRVTEDARRALRREGQPSSPPDAVLLGDFLAEPARPRRFLVSDLIPAGGRVVLAAQRKAGKSTLTGNLVRCLVDGDPFLGAHDVEPVTGRVVLLDDELDRDMLRTWLADQGIVNTERVAVVPLRGKVDTLDLLDPDTLTDWVARLRALDAQVVILDCLRPVLDALGLDESHEAGRFLVAFDGLLDRCGAQSAVVVHHAGHQGERSRGDSRLRDWPDVEWTLVREDPDDDRSARYFRAMGRDVDQPERLLRFDEDTRHLTVAGGSRRDAVAERAGALVLEVLAESDGLSQRQIEDRLSDDPAVTREGIRKGIALAKSKGWLTREKGGPRGAYVHRLATLSAPVRGSAPSVRQRGQSQCASAPIDGALTGAVDEGPSAPTARESA